jgi:hypothetical protein
LGFARAVILFSKAIVQAKWEANAPFREAMAIKHERLQGVEGAAGGRPRRSALVCRAVGSLPAINDGTLSPSRSPDRRGSDWSPAPGDSVAGEWWAKSASRALIAGWPWQMSLPLSHSCACWLWCMPHSNGLNGAAVPASASASDVGRLATWHHVVAGESRGAGNRRNRSARSRLLSPRLATLVRLALAKQGSLHLGAWNHLEAVHRQSADLL